MKKIVFYVAYILCEYKCGTALTRPVNANEERPIHARKWRTAKQGLSTAKRNKPRERRRHTTARGGRVTTTRNVDMIFTRSPLQDCSHTHAYTTHPNTEHISTRLHTHTLYSTYNSADAAA